MIKMLWKLPASWPNVKKLNYKYNFAWDGFHRNFSLAYGDHYPVRLV